MDKYIIREISPESCDINIMFDDDGLTAASGNFNNTLFILYYDHFRYNGFNYDEYKEISDKIDNFLDDFTEYRQPGETRKDVMNYYGLKYNPSLCHKLTEYAKKTPYISSPDQVAEYLTITTKKEWKTIGVHGYCQGDFVTVLYCTDNYTDKAAEMYGEYFLGCYKEFCVISLDENENEIDSCYGYFVADCQLEKWDDSEYKKIVCEYAGIPENETRLELIEGSYTTIYYNYKVV